jgi:hypothetical protein
MSALERPLAVLLTIVALTTNSRQFISIAASFSSFSSPSNADSIGDNQRVAAPLDLLRLLHGRFFYHPPSPLSTELNGIDCSPNESVSSPIACRGLSAENGQSDRKPLADDDASGRQLLQSLPKLQQTPFQTKSLTSAEALYRGARRSRPSRPFGQRFSPSSIMSGIAARSGELTSIRNRFTPWGGKRAPLSRSDEYEGGRSAAAARRGGFQPWGGKRNPVSSDGWQVRDDESGDQPWAIGPSSAAADESVGDEGKRGFHPWGGK